MITQQSAAGLDSFASLLAHAAPPMLPTLGNHMVSITHKICLSLIFFALVIFYSAYYYSGEISPGVFTYSEFITSITSIFSYAHVNREPSFEPQGFFINEDKAVLVFFCLSIFINILAISLAIWHRSTKGKSRLFIPVVFGALSVCGCIFFVGYQLGLDYSA